MVGRILLGGAIGVIVGTLIGHAGKSAGGACPILCHPTISAIFFAAMGMLIAGGIKGSAGSIELTGFQPVETEEQLQTALAVEKPALVEFYTDWCGYCKRSAPTMSALADEYGDRMVFVKIDGDKARGITREYGIRGYPTILFFNNGEETGRIVGARPEEEIRNAIESAVGGSGDATENMESE